MKRRAIPAISLALVVLFSASFLLALPGAVSMPASAVTQAEIDAYEKDQADLAKLQQMMKETIHHFNEYVSPGWLQYRKSVSSETDGDVVLEWEDGGSYFYA